jgi:hypothetical protein
MFAAVLVTTASAAPPLPKFPHSTPYSEARKTLKALGYRPIVLPDADAESRSRCGPMRDDAPPSDDERCFPEMEACAGTGLGQCIFTWQRGETIIEVLTTNELPIVSGVRCRVNC